MDTSPTEQRVRSADGTTIRFFQFGDSGPALVLAPGLGVPLVTYRDLFAHFAPNWRVVTWEPRGTYGSELAPGAGLSVRDHVADLEAVIGAAALDEFVLGGWSLAVQVSLEYAYHNRERCRALLLINGAYEAPVSGSDAGRRWLGRRLLGAARRLEPMVAQTLGAAARRPRFLRSFARHSPLVAANFDFFSEVAQGFLSQPPRVLVDTLLAADEHSAREYLADIHAPALITVGTRDWMTPPSTGRELVAAMPNARLVTIEGGTHYTPLEFPERITAEVSGFLSALGY